MDNRLTAEQVFHAAREKSDPAERAGFLHGVCGKDVSLRAKVEALLKADAEAGEFLRAAEEAPQSSPSAAPTLAATPRDQAGDMVGRYKLLQQIGEGGFGVVYMAEQREPVKRRVALKLIKLGMDTRQVIARFEAERQALAMMDHPHIARVLDAGTTETGRLYFVMDYIKGVPILEYCDTEKLDTRQRLDLFTKVCHAIQHAHQKGIIHRDIKPNNALVTMHDGVPVPKVIDFGIAKATSAELTTRTLFTEHRQMIGTPVYMSPEQAEMTGLDIDTRSDIYSLGVLLYELLTGTTPFAHEELMSKGLSEMMRIIREVEPHKPSTRLSSLGKTGTRTAQQRLAADPKELSQTLRGDLDWIIMKCLEKDRTRRYETANGLAMDIHRYLGGEAVFAAPPSTRYRLKKFIRRNRGLVTAGSAVAAALLIGVIAFAWQAEVARHQRDLALQAQAAARVQRDLAVQAQKSEAEQRLAAEQQRKAAEFQRDKAQMIAGFMGMMLQSADPWVAKGRDISVLKEMMDQGAEWIEKGQLKSFPEAELHMRETIGWSYITLAQYDAAQKMLEPAVALARSINPGDQEATAYALHNLAVLLQTRGDLAGAEPLFREAVEMRKRLGSHGVSQSLDQLSSLLLDSGELAEAESLKREALEILERISPPSDAPFNEEYLLTTAVNRMNLGFVLHARGNLAGAEPLFRDALEMARRVNPGDHPTVAWALNGRGRLLQARGDSAGAEPLLRESLDMFQRLSPGDHPTVAMGLAALARLLQERGDLAGAEPLFRESLEMRERLLGKEHRDTLVSIILMGGLRVAQGSFTEALALLVPIEGETRSAFTGGNAWKLANLLTHLGNARAGLAKTDADFAAAEANLLEAHANFVKAPGPFPKDTRDSVQALVDFYAAWHKAEPGKRYDAKAAEWKAKLDAAAP